ncbi:hypothetical protein NQ315_013313 [Exocentrus adspersus]|uniref:Uncharacterized protein n=1 Tax=Exocentrus adspersus TaxID=1586481 RepID=A0AAV8V7K4_9CUCU|nr:hypothetical protein NQ315_013313 [Exocentrus adspersus]
MEEFVFLHLIQDLEEAEIQANEGNRQKLNPRDPFVELDDDQFIKIFRLSKDLCRFVIESVTPFMSPKRRNTDLSISTRNLEACRNLKNSIDQIEQSRIISVAPIPGHLHN